MPSTRDHRDGPLYEEEIIFDELPSAPSAAGRMRYVGGSFSMRDASGIFDPRTGGSGGLLGRAIFKTDGGLIYDSSGNVVIKQVA